MPAIVNRNVSNGSVQDRMKRDIIDQINSGTLKPGDALYSTKKMSEIYKVSLVTAHKALKDLTARKYLIRQNGKGTFIAKRETISSFTNVGVPVYLQHNPFHVHMIEAISDQALKNKISIVLGQGSNEKQFIDKLTRNNISTMIRFPRDIAEESQIWKLLTKQKIQTVILNDFWLNGGSFSSVRTDEEYGIKKVMDHLISLGHRKIIFLDEDRDEQRIGAFNAYYQSLLVHNISFTPKRIMYVNDYKRDSEELVKKLLQLGTAVVVTYDLYAIRIMNALKKAGVKIGKDFSVAGFDGIAEAEKEDLTTLEQPIELLVEHAFKILDRKSQDAKPEKVSIKPKLIIRNSTGKLRK